MEILHQSQLVNMGGNIKVKPEEVRKLRERFLFDERIKALQNQLVKAYSGGPIGIEYKDGSCKLIYPKLVEQQADKIREMIDAIILADYRILDSQNMT